MHRQRGVTLTDLVVVTVLVVSLAGTFVYADLFGWRARNQVRCINNVRQIGLAMAQYSTEHDGRFPKLVDAQGNEVDAVDAKGNVSKEPARSAFAILMKRAYLTTTKVFVCPASGEKVPGDDFPTDFRNAKLQDLILAENNCSYGWDPTKTSNADATCALISDKPPQNVLKKHEGTARNNSDNHKKRGQNVWYSDGHVKWMKTSKPEAGKDPDFFLGGKDYWKSKWDAKIIR